MKTLVNKNNPAIRITAPEIEEQEESEMYLIPVSDYCIPMCIDDWTLVEEEPKPAEWSEEDEKDTAHIIRILDDCYAYGKHDLSKTDHENLVNKLKSLRTQPHWKPNEKQMDFLKDIINEYKYLARPKVVAVLQSLYNNLKEL